MAGKRTLIGALMQQDNRPKSNRFQSLDVLRGIAILFVIGAHFPFPPESYNWLSKSLLSEWKLFGWIGVELFFVLSGFLVSGLIFKEYQRTGRFSPFRFLIRRGLKIYPSLYFVLGSFLSIIFALGYKVPTRNILSEIFFLQNYLPNVLQVTWSLAVEEHFYLLLCLAMVCLSRDGGKDPYNRLPDIVVGANIFFLAARICNYPLGPVSASRNAFPTHLRLDSLLLGVLLGYLFHFREAELAKWFRRWGRFLPFVCALLLSPMFIPRMVESWTIYTFGFTFLHLGFGGVLLMFLYWYPVRVPNPALRIVFSGIAFIGVHSYPIYLWHDSLIRILPILAESVANHRLTYTEHILIAFAASIGVGVVTSYIVERPILYLRDRLVPSPTVGGQDVPPQPVVPVTVLGLEQTRNRT
jgi:peptidoglycan/LPS O-acetylase OafA/YrhL